MQTAVNATPSGGTLNVTGCGPYGQVVTISHPMTLVGASILHGGAAAQSGNIEVSGTDHVTVDHASVVDSAGACISADNSTYVTVSNSLMSGCAQEGYHFSHTSHVTFTGNHLYHNNPAHQYGFGFEAGGGKACFTNDSIFSNNESDHNLGAGLWFDCADAAITITGNRVHDNVTNGIFYETGLSGTITNNVVWNNDWTIASEYGWAWGAGILVSSSANTEVSGNVVAWNGDGITVVSQNRDDQPPSGIVGNYIRDNKIVGVDNWPDSDQNYGLGWLQDWSGVMFNGGSANRAAANAFWYATAEGPTRFAWSGDYSSRASFAGTAGGAGSTYMTDAAKVSLLQGAGVPASHP